MVRIMWGPDHELVVIRRGRGKLVDLKKRRPSRAYLFAAVCFAICGFGALAMGSAYGLAWIALAMMWLVLHRQQK